MRRKILVTKYTISITSKHHVTHLVRWKINVDDYSFQNLGNAGFGGILRNDRGSWIQGFLVLLV